MDQIEAKLTREDYLLLARLAQQTERYHEMVEFIQKFILSEDELSQEERNIVSAAYKNVVGNKRAELRVLTAIEQKESKRPSQGENINLTYIRNYKHKIEKELKNSCTDILNTLEKHLIPTAKDIHNKVFYLKMRGDYNRYLAEFLLDDDYNKALENALSAYKEADKLSKIDLAPTHPIRLGLYLNMSVFYYEIMQKQDEAIRLANQAFEDAIAHIDSVNEENYKDCTLIMQLLRDNLTLWSNDIQMEGGQFDEN